MPSTEDVDYLVAQILGLERRTGRIAVGLSLAIADSVDRAAVVRKLCAKLNRTLEIQFIVLKDGLLRLINVELIVRAELEPGQ